MQEADRVRRQLAPGAKSDHITFLNAYLGWLNAKRAGNVCLAWTMPHVLTLQHAKAHACVPPFSFLLLQENGYCWRNFLSGNTLKMIGRGSQRGACDCEEQCCPTLQQNTPAFAVVRHRQHAGPVCLAAARHWLCRARCSVPSARRQAQGQHQLDQGGARRWPVPQRCECSPPHGYGRRRECRDRDRDTGRLGGSTNRLAHVPAHGGVASRRPQLWQGAAEAVDAGRRQGQAAPQVGSER